MPQEEIRNVYERSLGILKVCFMRRFVTTQDKAVVCLYKYDTKEWSFDTTKMILDFEAKTWGIYRNGYLYSVRGNTATGSCDPPTNCMTLHENITFLKNSQQFSFYCG